MSTVTEIETAVKKLSRKELAAFRSWFVEYDAENWDRQFEKDAKAGHLNTLAEKALKDHAEGRCTDL